MKTLWMLSVMLLCSCESEDAASHNGNLTREFREVCATYRGAQFEERLARVVSVGMMASQIQELLTIADQRRIEPEATIYIFSETTGAYFEQGLVVSISVNKQTGLVDAVQSAIAAN